MSLVPREGRQEWAAQVLLWWLKAPPHPKLRSTLICQKSVQNSEFILINLMNWVKHFIQPSLFMREMGSINMLIRITVKIKWECHYIELDIVSNSEDTYFTHPKGQAWSHGTWSWGLCSASQQLPPSKFLGMESTVPLVRMAPQSSGF